MINLIERSAVMRSTFILWEHG